MAGEWDSVPEDERVWEYKPNLPAALVFCIFWFITVIIHFIQMIQHRKWYLSVLIMGSIWELIGFVLRVVSTYYPVEVKYYAPSMSFIVLAPVLIIAFYYMTVGRLILLFLPEKRVFRIPAHRITLLFLAGDIFSFLIQMVGTNLLVSSDPTASEFEMGQNILIAGLAVQTGVFLLFIILTIRFEHNYTRAFGSDLDFEEGRERWRKFMRVINICCVCIVIRSIFRLAEFAMPYPGVLVRYEAPFYLLEAVPMLPCSYLFHWHHPAKVLVGEESSFRIAGKERKRVKKEEKAEKKAAKKEKKEMKKAAKRAKVFDEDEMELGQVSENRRASLSV
ncbi:hypothetical protein EX30DRAFT_124370 [Ascodesmis nigricans]|uniref:RTA1-domain-containing protein n=1 Tax=Ascodesmis nigricans TaxID=341454 RepID=A0A4S2MPE5_9PEZI|nr:hypothetical protein EX30DRAFT_124370 [Ascodesmis nigricans]